MPPQEDIAAPVEPRHVLGVMLRLPTSVFVADANGRIHAANPAHCRTMGLPMDRLQGLPAWAQAGSQREAERLRAYLEASLDEGAPRDGFVGVVLSGEGPVLGRADRSHFVSAGPLRAAVHTMIPARLEDVVAILERGEVPCARSTTGALHALLSGLPRLTARERAVVAPLLRGDAIVDIADALQISLSTVRNHIQSVYRKIGVTSRDRLHALVAEVTSASRRAIH